MSTDLRITRIQSVDPSTLAALSTLLPQLSSSAPVLTHDRLSLVVSNPNNHLFVAVSLPEETIVGTLTLTIASTLIGVRAYIEDVVVDTAARRRGVGAALIREAVRVALSEEVRATSIDLTSRPERIEANRLYQNLGFQRRETNVYRWQGA